MNDRKEERLKRDAEKFRANLKIGRPGFGAERSDEVEVRESLNAGKDRIELSGILWLDPEKLKENPYNEYVSLSDEELSELASDIKRKGVLVPLIVRLSEDVLICGHNRRRASIEAKENPVPVQRVLRLLSEAEEREIMKSENDRRRGGNWSKEQKVEFIQEHFSDRLDEDNRGGDRKSEGAKNQNFSEVLNTGGLNQSDQDSMNLEKRDQNFNEVLKQKPVSLATEIEEKSRGKIPKGTADRLLSEIRKEKKHSFPSVAKSLSEKERKRGEKLALQLRTLQETREKLEGKLKNVKEEEKRVIKELKSIGQPELFGVKP